MASASCSTSSGTTHATSSASTWNPCLLFPQNGPLKNTMAINAQRYLSSFKQSHNIERKCEDPYAFFDCTVRKRRKLSAGKSQGYTRYKNDEVSNDRISSLNGINSKNKPAATSRHASMQESKAPRRRTLISLMDYEDSFHEFFQEFEEEQPLKFGKLLRWHGSCS